MKLLRVEPYLLLVMFQVALKGTPSSQLLQAKICMNWYNTTASTAEICPHSRRKATVPGTTRTGFWPMSLSSVNQSFHLRKFTRTYFYSGTYSTYINTIPGLVWALFIGAWIDRYVKGRKILMLFSVGASIIENLITIYLSISFKTSECYATLSALVIIVRLGVYYGLLLQVPTSILGGQIASRIAITHYQSSTTPPKLMAIRFMIFDMCMSVGEVNAFRLVSGGIGRG